MFSSLTDTNFRLGMRIRLYNVWSEWHQNQSTSATTVAPAAKAAAVAVAATATMEVLTENKCNRTPDSKRMKFDPAVDLNVCKEKVPSLYSILQRTSSGKAIIEWHKANPDKPFEINMRQKINAIISQHFNEFLEAPLSAPMAEALAHQIKAAFPKEHAEWYYGKDENGKVAGRLYNKYQNDKAKMKKVRV